MLMKTDSQIQEDVLAELKWEPAVHAAGVGVEVKDGIVTLAGHVESYAEKIDAEHAAQRVSGVKALAVEIDVRLPGSSRRTDGEIADAAQSALQWTTVLPKNKVKVTVEKGWVTLGGEVDWQYQRQSAVQAVHRLTGVVAVSDHTVVKPKVSVSAVKSDIEAALERRAHTDARAISVSVDGSDVTLAGEVHSWSERDLAINSAWGTPGVYNVIDNIELTY